MNYELFKFFSAVYDVQGAGFHLPSGGYGKTVQCIDALPRA
mgnify:CR=1 FL=1